MKLILTSLIASFSLTGAAIAGNLTTTSSEPAPATIVPQAIQGIGWTGAYAGLQYGRGDFDVSLEEASAVFLGHGFGIHAGYLYDLGQLVLGGEVSYDRMSSDEVDGSTDVLRLRGRAGYDLDKFLPYVTLGVTRVTEYNISEMGITYGIGAEYLVTDQFSVGLEYSKSEFSDIENTDGLDLNVDLIQVRASYRF